MGPGTEFEIEDRGDSLVLRPVRRLRTTTVDDLVGCTGYRGPRISLEEMDSAIEREAKKSG